MEQIYYTQCPIGYGLGASNGFQTKRISAGYPASGDVRHLALRAFLPGTGGRDLAPGVLRYRRVGESAEVAWLTPRPREYRTERGSWGRPGGHFAHGLRLDPEELATLDDWPAGLFDRPFWRREDPEPSRGRRPDSLEVGPEDLVAPPRFEAVAPLIDLGRDQLARLLDGIAQASRTGRTAFLVDLPDRLAPRIASATFAFPARLRGDLTFSTYHDRPEELIGFRIQGTCPTSTTPRPLLAGMGPIVDLASDRPEPTSAAIPSWASTLAGWLTRCDPHDAEDWNATDAFARRARVPDNPATLWSDPWLDGLIGLAGTIRSEAPPPPAGDSWSTIASMASWAAKTGLAAELATAWGPEWWREAARLAVADTRAHEAFWALVLAPELWEAATERVAAAWGNAVAPFWARYRRPQRERLLVAMLRKVSPTPLLTRMLDALLRSVGPEAGHEAIEWLGDRPEIGPEVLLPLRAPIAVTLLRDRGRDDAIAQIVARAAAVPGALPTVLDLLRVEAEHADLVGSVAEATARAVPQADPAALAAIERWALHQSVERGDDWIAPILDRLFAPDDDRPSAEALAEWHALRERTPDGLLVPLTSACLLAADRPEADPGALPWAVESLVLPLPSRDRPDALRWVPAYLANIGSSYVVAKRMDRFPDLVDWIDSVGRREELPAASLAILDDADVIRVVLEGHGESLGAGVLGRVPDRDRPDVLALMLDRAIEGGRDGIGDVLGRCAAWPGAFEAGSPGLQRFAAPIADAIEPRLAGDPGPLKILSTVLDRLGIAEGAPDRWAASGIAAEVLAASCRRMVAADAWRLRSTVLADPIAYPILARDLGGALRRVRVEQAAEVAGRWAVDLDKGIHSARFFEILLNACDGPRLARVVPSVVAELLTLGPLPWWEGPATDPLPSDLRDAFALLAPMGPISPGRSLPSIDRWVRRATRPSSILVDPDLPLPLEPEGNDAPLPEGRRPTSPLSEAASGRWECLRSLSIFHQDARPPSARWDLLRSWRDQPDAAPPLNRLGTVDLDRAIAWLILGLDHPGAGDYKLEALARWLVHGLGLRSRSRVAGSLEVLAEDGVPIPDQAARLARELAHEVGMQLKD